MSDDAVTAWERQLLDEECERLEATAKKLENSKELEVSAGQLEMSANELEKLEGKLKDFILLVEAELGNVEDIVHSRAGKFKPPEDSIAFNTLPFFMQWASTHLLLLDRKIYWQELSQGLAVDGYKRDYEKYFRDYIEYAREKKQSIALWRRGRIIWQSRKYTKAGESRYSIVYKDRENPDVSYDSNSESKSEWDAAEKALATVTEAIDNRIKKTVDPVLDRWEKQWNKDKERTALWQPPKKGGAKGVRLAIDTLQFTCLEGEDNDVAEVVDLELDFVREYDGEKGYVRGSWRGRLVKAEETEIWDIEEVYDKNIRWKASAGGVPLTYTLDWKKEIRGDYNMWFEFLLEEEDDLDNDQLTSKSEELYCHQLIYMATCGKQTHPQTIIVSAGDVGKFSLTFDLNLTLLY